MRGVGGKFSNELRELERGVNNLMFEAFGACHPVVQIRKHHRVYQVQLFKTPFRGGERSVIFQGTRVAVGFFLAGYMQAIVRHNLKGPTA